MNTEQKAKAYDEAIIKLREYILQFSDRVSPREDLEKIFPELKETTDERIRKALIHYIKTTKSDFIMVEQNKATSEEALCWLEQQESESVTLECGKWYLCIKDYQPRADCNDFYQGEKYLCTVDGHMNGRHINHPEKYFRECEKPVDMDWTSDDEKLLGKCIDAASGYYSAEDKLAMKDWLRSIKSRFHRYELQEWKNTWVPTDEQIVALDNYIFCLNPDDEKYGDDVKSLYHDLCNLRNC